MTTRCAGPRYRDLTAPAATALEDGLGRAGGFCDCEVSLNGWQLARRRLVRDVRTDELEAPEEAADVRRSPARVHTAVRGLGAAGAPGQRWWRTRSMTSDARLAIPDVNVLVALTNASHVFHTESHRWLAGGERYATTPVTESGIVRMLLNPAVTGQPVTPEQALGVLSGIRADARASFLVDDSSLADADVDTTGLAGHQQVTDWHPLNLAATRRRPRHLRPEVCTGGPARQRDGGRDPGRIE